MYESVLASLSIHWPNDLTGTDSLMSFKDFHKNNIQQNTWNHTKLLSSFQFIEKVTSSGITGRGWQGEKCPPPPETSDWKISADIPDKKRQGKKGKGVEIEKKRMKIVKGKVENWKWKVEKWGEAFFFFFFCLSLFKTTKICFGSTKVVIFYQEKAFHAGKKIRKNDFAPSEKFSCYAPG